MTSEWYDFGMVEFDIEGKGVSTYPSLLLGFIELPKNHPLSYHGSSNENYAIVKCATAELEWATTVEADFITKFTLCDKDESLCIVPASAVVHPLLVFDNPGGGENDYYCSLPRSNWDRYFGDKIE